MGTRVRSALLGLGVFLFTTAQAQNFINGSFEAWGSAACDINTAPDNWTNFSNAGIGADEAKFPGCPSTIPSAPANGAVYARFYAANATSGEGFQQTVTGLTVGVGYEVRYFYCGSNLYGGAGSNQVHLYLDGVDLHQSPVFLSSLATWNMATFNFTATATSATIGFRMFSPANPTGSGALDNVSLSSVFEHEALKLWTSKQNDGGITLHWDSRDGSPVELYEVERQIEGGNWQVVGEVSPGNGTSFDWNDTPVFNSKTVHYRIREKLADGNGAVSKVVFVELDNRLTVQIWPTPTHGVLNVRGGSETEAPKVIHPSGLQLNCDASRTDEGWAVDVSKLEPGLYLLLIIKEDGTKIVERFIVVDNE